VGSTGALELMTGLPAERNALRPHRLMRASGIVSMRRFFLISPA
jgi:hypothetical protein